MSMIGGNHLKKKIIIGAALICALFLILVKNKDLSLADSSSEKQLVLTEEERDYLESLGPITMAVDPDWEPFEWIDENGEFKGIAADLIALIEERLDITFEIIPTENWPESVALSKVGDVMVLPFLNQTPERDQWLIFTDPLFIDPNAIITHRSFPMVSDLSNIDDVSMVLPEGTSVGERVGRDYPHIELIKVETEKEAFDKVENLEVDMTMRSLTVAAYTIRNEGYLNLKVAGQVSEYTNFLRMGVLVDEPMLRDILNKGIATITPQERESVVNDYIYIKVNQAVDTRKFWLTIVFLLFVTLIAFFIAFLFNQKKKEIQKKDEQLKKVLDKYQLIAENTQDVIWVLNYSKRKLTYVSPSVFNLRGVTQEEAMNELWEETLEDDKRAEYLAMFDSAIEKGLISEDYTQNLILTLKQKHKKGGSVYVDIKARRIEPNKSDVWILGVSRNAEERIKRESELKNQAEFHMLLSSWSKKFIETPMEKWELTLKKVLKEMGHFFKVSRCYYFTYSFDTEEIGHWVIVNSGDKVFPITILDLHVNQIKGFQGVYVYEKKESEGGVETLHSFINDDKVIQSIWIPLDLGEEKAVLAFDYCEKKKEITQTELIFYQLFSNLVLENIKRYKLTQHLDETNEELELSFYQAQINPHFLYNALSAIAMYCDIEPQEASRLIIELSKFLRSCFDFKSLNREVTLEDEIDLIKSYLEIEKIRFEDRLTVHWDLDERLKGFFMAPLLIQPLVENAIKHGLMKCVEGGDLYISIKTCDDTLNCLVTDNGMGMSKETLEDLKSKMKKSHGDILNAVDSKSRTGVGLLNVQRRLAKLYGSKLRIESFEGEGTHVGFKIPLKSKETNQ